MRGIIQYLANTMIKTIYPQSVNMMIDNKEANNIIEDDGSSNVDHQHQDIENNRNKISTNIGNTHMMKMKKNTGNGLSLDILRIQTFWILNQKNIKL